MKSTDEKIHSALKEAFIKIIIEEYKNSHYSNFTEFMYHVLLYYGISYFPTYMSDSELAQKVSEYNSINLMNDALE